jgi:hypothetical protein
MEMKMKTKIIAILSVLLLLLVATSTFAKEINMKTNEVYKAEFTATNGATSILINCEPYFDGELGYQSWVTISPSTFSLSFNDEKKIIISFNNPDAGYYTGKFNIKCERALNGQDLGTEDIINPSSAPTYEVIVSDAGVDQAYVISPAQQYNFLSKPGLTEKATFTIANIGAENLPIEITVPSPYDQYIIVSPNKFNLLPSDSQIFTIQVKTPQDFEYLQTNLQINIGDFNEEFLIIGELESVVSTGVALQSIGGSDLKIGGLEIPIPIIVGLLIGAAVLLVRSNNGDKKRKK